jgi:hypothetical protein
MCINFLGMLFGLPHIQMASWVKYIGPNSNIAIGGLSATFCGTPVRPVLAPDRLVLLAVGIFVVTTLSALVTRPSGPRTGLSDGYSSAVPCVLAIDD